MSSWTPPTQPFSTIRATVRDWSRHQRISALQGLSEAGSDDEGEEQFCRLFVGPDRQVHEEWDSGRVHDAVSLEESTNWPLLDPAWLADHQPLTIVGPREAAGREGVAVETIGEDGPAGMLLPGANRCVGIFDRERAVLLRCEAWLDDELLMVEELTEVVFDEPLDPQLFGSRP